MTCTDIASGLSLDGTDHSTTAVFGACSATPHLQWVFAHAWRFCYDYDKDLYCKRIRYRQDAACNSIAHDSPSCRHAEQAIAL